MAMKRVRLARQHPAAREPHQEGGGPGGASRSSAPTTWSSPGASSSRSCPSRRRKEEFQRRYINEVLARNSGNRTKTAHGPGGRPADHLPPPRADGGREARRDLRPRRDAGRGGLTEASHAEAGPIPPTSRNLPESRHIGRGPALAIRLAVLVCALTGRGRPGAPERGLDRHPGRTPAAAFRAREYLQGPARAGAAALPAGSADAALTPPCHCELELNIPLVEEDDPTVSLEVRWFIDYDVRRALSTVRTWQTLSFPAASTPRTPSARS